MTVTKEDGCQNRCCSGGKLQDGHLPRYGDHICNGQRFAIHRDGAAMISEQRLEPFPGGECQSRMMIYMHGEL